MFDVIFKAILSIGVPLIALWLNRSNKLLSFTKVARIIKGLIGEIAAAYPTWTVAQVIDKIIQDIMDRFGISRAAAENAVRSVQVELGLPTGEDAKQMKINDIWTGRVGGKVAGHGHQGG